MATTELNITANTADAEKKVKNLAGNLEKLEGVTTRLGGSASRTGDQARKMGKSIDRSGKEAKSATAHFRALQANVVGLRNAFVGLFTGSLILNRLERLTVELFETQAAWVSMNNAMVASTGNMEAAGKEMAYLYEQSVRMGVAFDDLASSHAKLSVAGRKLGLSLGETRDLTESIAEASVAMNLNATDTNRVFRAFTQVLSKGKLQAEEIRNQIGEHIPGAFQIAAEAMGVTQVELSKMLELGEVMSDEFARKLPAALKATFADAFARASRSSRAELSRLRTEVEFLKVGFTDELEPFVAEALGNMATEVRKFRGEFDFSSAATGFRTFLADMADSLADFIDHVENSKFYASGGLIGYMIGGFLGARVKMFKGIFKIAGAALGAEATNTMSKMFEGFGVTSPEIEELQSRLRLVNDEILRLKVLTGDRGELLRADRIGTLSTRADELTAKIKELKAELIEADQSGVFTNVLRGFADGLRTGREEVEMTGEALSESGTMITKWGQVWNEVANEIDGSINGLSKSIVDFALTGKASFDDFFKSLLTNIAELIVQLMIVKPLIEAITSSGWFAGLGTAIGGPTSVPTGGATPSVPNAKGNAFSGGNIIPFARGGVVRSPTVFPMARGMGLMGEAGPEGVLPLARTASGDLGVQTTGAMSPTINIYNQAGVEANVTTSPDGMNIDIMLTQKMKSLIGSGALDKQMNTTYGISRRGR
jgi:tape measure domain-containing protein